jgi:hypothetical protein
MKKIFYFFIAILIFAACQNDKTSQKTDEKTTQTSPTPTTKNTTGDAVTKGKYTLYPSPSSTEYPDASLEYYHYQDGIFHFIVNGESYRLGAQTLDAPQKECANSAKGQHIHLIIDDEPYKAAYNQDFEHVVHDGRHYMMAFLSRSYHESIKTDKAFVALKLQVKNNTVYATSTIKEPALFYSRPTGEYVGDDTKKILLDFHLWEADLSGAFKVLLEINGEEKYIIDKWQSYYIEGLPMGENKIKLTLVYNSGEVVQTKFNGIERTITLKP